MQYKAMQPQDRNARAARQWQGILMLDMLMQVMLMQGMLMLMRGNA